MTSVIPPPVAKHESVSTIHVNSTVEPLFVVIVTLKYVNYTFCSVIHGVTSLFSECKVA